MNLVGMSTKRVGFTEKGELGIKIKIPSYINYSQEFDNTVKFKFDISIQHILFQNGLELGLLSWKSKLITNNQIRDFVAWNENSYFYSTGKMGILGSIYNKDTLSSFDILIQK